MIPIRFEADPLPADFTGSLQDFQTRFLLNLRGIIDETQVLTGQIGGARPTEDTGPWFDGNAWNTWNGTEYVPSVVKVAGAGYVVQLGDYTSVGAKNILPDFVQTLQDKDGTVALLEDVYKARPTVILSGTTPTIDGNLSENFAHLLPGNTTYKLSNISDGQEITLTSKNNATSYTVTFSSTPAVFWPAGSPPSQTASKTDVYIIKNVAGSLIGRQLNNY